MKYFIALLVLLCEANGQQRILVQPNNEIIRLNKSESALSILDKEVTKNKRDCFSNLFRFGYSSDIYPSPAIFNSFHKDVLGMWFVAPASGTINTLFCYIENVRNYYSPLSIRIFESNIYPGHGPGFSPYPSPCMNWGYYLDSNDLDNGITPFRDRTTDTQWISTAPNSLTTFDPLGNELLGDGGFNIKVNPQSTNSLQF